MEAVSSSGIFTVASKRSARIEFIQICSLLPRRIMQMSSGMNNPEKAGNGRHFACSVPENSGNQSPPSLSKQNTIRNNILHHEYYYYFLFLIRYVFVCLVLLSTNSGSIVNSAYCCAGCNSSRDVQISSQLSFFLSFFWWFDFLFLSLSLSLSHLFLFVNVDASDDFVVMGIFFCLWAKIILGVCWQTEKSALTSVNAPRWPQWTIIQMINGLTGHDLHFHQIIPISKRKFGGGGSRGGGGRVGRR